MGFGASPAVAQAVTDIATERADLPPSRRLVMGSRPPSGLPVWGSILGDVWVIRDATRNDGAETWMDDVTAEWSRVGVQNHPGKDVSNEPSAEIQGALVDGQFRTVGLSFSKTARLMTAGLWLLGQARPARRAVERLLGKIGFAHSFRPAGRAAFQHAFRWVQEAREKRLRRISWTSQLWSEFFEALVMLPLCQLELAAPWSSVVQCSDAAGSEKRGPWNRLCRSRM